MTKEEFSLLFHRAKVNLVAFKMLYEPEAFEAMQRMVEMAVAEEREALKMALEVFGGSDWHEEIVDSAWADKANKAITAIKEVLAEQEHVSYSGNGTAGRETDVRPTGFVFQMPPQRTWVGLTIEDVKVIEDNAPSKQMAIFMAEATLKEKNGG